MGSASLTATSSPLPAKVTGPSSSSYSLGAAGKKSAACTSIKRSDLARLFTVAVGSPYYEGSGACVYGIGPNSKLKGPPIETAETDTFLAQLFPALGPSQYKYYTTTGGKATVFRAAGYKASYRAQVAFGQMEGFSVYVLKGTLFCLMDLNLSRSSEVGLGRLPVRSRPWKPSGWPSGSYPSAPTSSPPTDPPPDSPPPTGSANLGPTSAPATGPGRFRA